MNEHGLHFYEPQKKDENWSYALPEDIYRQIEKHDVDSDETRLLFEILSEQISLFIVSKTKKDVVREYEGYESEKSLFRRKLEYQTKTIQSRLDEVVNKLRQDKRYEKYHYLLHDMEMNDNNRR